jgi:hypothetical protein
MASEYSSTALLYSIKKSDSCCISFELPQPMTKTSPSITENTIRLIRIDLFLNTSNLLSESKSKPKKIGASKKYMAVLAWGNS